MSAPRNRARFEAARADQAAITAVLGTRRQSEPLLKPKDVLRILGWPESKHRTVQRHMKAIRLRR